MLTSLISLLEIDLKSLWGLAQPEEEFLQLFAKVVFHMMESSVNTKDSGIRRCLSVILVHLAKVVFALIFCSIVSYSL